MEGLSQVESFLIRRHLDSVSEPEVSQKRSIEIAQTVHSRLREGRFRLTHPQIPVADDGVHFAIVSATHVNSAGSRSHSNVVRLLHVPAGVIALAECTASGSVISLRPQQKNHRVTLHVGRHSPEVEIRQIGRSWQESQSVERR
ncbi:hypothetical protein Mapa_004632 [Marchantia paleacea]|nr:hypothetical protein Mapa_004632 [Marchantia paleacea]